MTIQRTDLRGIRYSLIGWNALDGEVSQNGEQMLSAPTSNPHTFHNVKLFYAFAQGQADPDYWRVRYRLEGKIVVIYGPDGNIVEEEVSTIVYGCFSGKDPNYVEIFPDCKPPQLKCAET